MENFILDEAIPVCYVTATSFPGGIMEAHQQLHSIIPFTPQRKYYGISFPDTMGTIIYKAAAEIIYEGEAEEKGLETFILKKGTYRSILLKNYMDNIPAIGLAFKELLTQPGLDSTGACVEWYLDNKQVQCMVLLR